MGCGIFTFSLQISYVSKVSRFKPLNPVYTNGNKVQIQRETETSKENGQTRLKDKSECFVTKHKQYVIFLQGKKEIVATKTLTEVFRTVKVTLLMNINESKFLFISAKGQIISKGFFGILGFFQKTNARIRFLVLLSKKNEFFRSFFGRIRGYQKSF